MMAVWRERERDKRRHKIGCRVKKSRRKPASLDAESGTRFNGGLSTSVGKG